MSENFGTLYKGSDCHYYYCSPYEVGDRNLIHVRLERVWDEVCAAALKGDEAAQKFVKEWAEELHKEKMEGMKLAFLLSNPNWEGPLPEFY